MDPEACGMGCMGEDKGRPFPPVLEPLMCWEDHRIQCRERKGQREAGVSWEDSHTGRLSGGLSVLLYPSRAQVTDV